HRTRLSVIATFEPAGARVAAFGFCALTRSRPWLGLRFVVALPSLQLNAVSSLDAPFFVRPFSGGTTHCGGVWAAAVTVTAAAALSFAVFASGVADAAVALTDCAPPCVPRTASTACAGVPGVTSPSGHE